MSFSENRFTLFGTMRRAAAFMPAMQICSTCRWSAPQHPPVIFACRSRAQLAITAAEIGRIAEIEVGRGIDVRVASHRGDGADAAPALDPAYSSPTSPRHVPGART